MPDERKPQTIWRPVVLRSLWWWQHRMGWPGALAMAMLLGLLALVLGVRPWIEQTRQQQLRTQVLRLSKPDDPQQAKPEVDTREAWLAGFPVWSDRQKTIAQLLKFAEMNHVEFERAEYVVEEANPDLLQVRITLPLTTTYVQLRTLTGSMLNGLPHASLDDIQLEAAAGDAGALKGRVRMSLYFRKEAP